jgi:hypothetical protein
VTEARVAMSPREADQEDRPGGAGATRFLVLGCGHTGTTLVSGILHVNGYRSFKVSSLFESLALNALNRAILRGEVADDRPIQAFLARLERRTGGRWALKDPRLCQTAGRFYRNIVAPTKIIFNFRDPGATVRSLRREREEHEPHLSPAEMQAAAEDEYVTRTSGALAFLDAESRSPVLFIRYDDLLARRQDAALARFVGHPLDMSFVQPGKRVSTPIPVSDRVLELHAEVERRYRINQREYPSAADAAPPAAGLTLSTLAQVKTVRALERLRRLAARVGL